MKLAHTLTNTRSKLGSFMPWRSEIQAVLQAFFGLLTQPFEQSPSDAVKGAATAIALSETFAAVGENDILHNTTISVVLVIIWMVVSAVCASADRRKLQIARNIGVISFWIAATSALILAADQFYANPFERGPRVEFVWGGLFFLVPAHMFRSLRFGPALGITLALWASTGFMAYTLVYARQ